jgi:hypothetical protein
LYCVSQKKNQYMEVTNELNVDANTLFKELPIY